MKESMDLKPFVERGNMPLAQWWQETSRADEMTRILQELFGRRLTDSERTSLKRQPLVEDSELSVIDSIKAYTKGGPNKAGRYRLLQEMLAFEGWAKANALRAVVGNPFKV
jgi:hypothetical protein